MKDNIIKFFGKYQNQLLPFMLSVILASSLYSVYGISFISVWTLGIAAVNILAFSLCNFVNKHKFLGSIVLIVVIILALSTFFNLISGNDYGALFQQWMLTGSDEVTTRIEYLLAFLVSFVPFFAVTIYYFTCVLYRMSFLTLICLIPCAVYVKVLTDINIVYISLIAVLNVAVLMSNIRNNREKDRVVIGKSASALSAAVFTFVLLLISAAVPKEDDARYYDRFEDLFMNAGNNSAIFDNYSMFSEFSGGADLFRNPTNRRMYNIYSSQAPYFKRQTFDRYDFENDRWYGEAEYSDIYYSDFEWSSNAENLSLESLHQALKAASEYDHSFVDKYSLRTIIDYDIIEDRQITASIEPVNFAAAYYLSPVRCIEITPLGQSEQIYVTRGGVFRNREMPHEMNLMYQVKFYDEYSSRYYWFELGGANFDDNTTTSMLNDLSLILRENNNSLADTAEAFLNTHLDALEYKNVYSDDISDIPNRISELAQEITAGFSFDWEKANALQNYFISNDYVYDLNYIAPDPSVEYFLFESKRGSCSDYAAAYVLLARSLGLTVRYTEGYSPDITSRDGYYIINDSCSHAYPEVYIQNMGWIVFEPTVPSGYSDVTGADNTTVVVSVDYELIFVICVIAGIVLIMFLMLLVAYPYFSVKRFEKTIHTALPNDCAVMIYNRLTTKTASKIIRRCSYMTPYEFARDFEEITELDISQLAFIIEHKAYGDEQVSEDEKKMIIDIYFKAKEAVKEFEKSQKIAERKQR